MIFNDHSALEGQHAFLSPSNYHWINYTDEKLQERWTKARAHILGVQLHDFARNAIKLGINLPKSKKTLNLYVNDAIGYKMACEQALRYSENAFGTADAISFRKNFLRVHDLKTGVTPASFKQLEVYAALFCLEYGYSPFDIKIELRIYQKNEVLVHIPDPEEIERIMNRIIEFDMKIEMLKERGEA